MLDIIVANWPIFLAASLIFFVIGVSLHLKTVNRARRQIMDKMKLHGRRGGLDLFNNIDQTQEAPFKVNPMAIVIALSCNVLSAMTAIIGFAGLGMDIYERYQ